MSSARNKISKQAVCLELKLEIHVGKPEKTTKQIYTPSISIETNPHEIILHLNTPSGSRPCVALNPKAFKDSKEFRQFTGKVESLLKEAFENGRLVSGGKR